MSRLDDMSPQDRRAFRLAEYTTLGTLAFVPVVIVLGWCGVHLPFELFFVWVVAAAVGFAPWHQATQAHMRRARLNAAAARDVEYEMAKERARQARRPAAERIPMADARKACGR